MEPALFSKFVIVALPAFVGQMFCFFMRRSGKNTMLVRLVWKWSGVLAFTALFGFALEYLMAGKNFYALLGISLTLVVLADTVWTRIAIAAFSATLPRRFIKPRQIDNAWRPGNFFYELKRQIENAGFKKCLSLRSDFPDNNDIYELSTHFLSKDKKTLLSVSFAMERMDLQTFFTLESKTDTLRIITGNQCLTDGLYFPSDYRRELRLWVCKFEKILKLHKKRTSQETLIDIPTPTLETLWCDCIDIENENLKRGILTPHSEIEEYGILTSDGKYKLWMDTLLLNYFAITPKS